MSNPNWKADWRKALGYSTLDRVRTRVQSDPITTTELGYKLGYSREPVPGIAHPIAVPAPTRGVNSIPRPRTRSSGDPSPVGWQPH